MDEFFKLFVNGGAVGILGGVLWYLLTHINPKLEAIALALLEGMRDLTAAHNRNAEATALRMIASPHISAEIKERASQIIEATKASEEERKRP